MQMLVLVGDRAPGSSTSTEKAPQRPGERSGSSEREVLVGDKARILLDAEMMPEKSSGKLNPIMLSTPSANSTPKKSSLAPASAAAVAEAARAALEEKAAAPAAESATTTVSSAAPPATTTTITQATANGPTRIPQRRGPLNMTLDLSVTTSWCSDWALLGKPSYDDERPSLDFSPSSSGAVSGFQDQQSRRIFAACCLSLLSSCRLLSFPWHPPNEPASCPPLPS